MRARSATRTRSLPLRSNPGAHAVAVSDDAGQVSGGTHCCSPSYLVITSRDTGRAIATKDTRWTVSQAVASSRITVRGPSAMTVTPGDLIRPSGMRTCLAAIDNAHNGGPLHDNHLVLPLPPLAVPKSSRKRPGPLGP